MGTISRNMTESIELEERLRRTEVIAAVEQIGATVAHDLRGPLGQIVQSIQMVKWNPTLTSRILKLIEESATRSLKMIADWRSSTREIVPQPVKTNLGSLIKHVLEGTTISSSTEVTSTIGEELDSVSLDPDIMHRVIDNLVETAVDSMPHSRKLTIEAKKCSAGTVISVSDVGIGIPEEVRERIFAPSTRRKRGAWGSVSHTTSARLRHTAILFHSRPRRGRGPHSP
jgi:signal transduction histidine kinase